jgi:dolichol-phosphate mannosyltransferase
MTDLMELSERDRLVRKERQASVGGGFRAPLVSIIIPTLNERDNVREIVSCLDKVLAGHAWEVVFVDDDSRDGTLEVLRDLSRSDPRVRYLHRIGRRGLASAVTEGILSTSSPFVAVMDCDLQHDVTVLPAMLARAQEPDCDIAVASRFLATAGVGDWSRNRLFLSNVAKKLAHFVLASKITDPMSGFFVIRRNAFEVAVRDLSNQGYKILLDILLSAKPSLRGESKVEPIVVLEYFTLLFDKLFGHVIPSRFVVFSLVGGGGLLVHMAVLATLNRGFGADFKTAEIYAAVAAMIFNFFANNLLTYRDMRLVGLWPTVRGLLVFCALCSIGIVANVGIATALFRQDYSWWLAGLAGVLVGAVWNYATTSIFTWRRS